MLPRIVALAFFLSRVAVAQWQVRQAFSDNSTVAPITSNSLQMKGFNFSTLTGDALTFPSSTETWNLHVNYTIGPWDDDVTRPYYSYALAFPEAALPTLNESNWRLCAHVLQFALPDNITNLALPADATAGDCSPYLGDACVQDYTSALASSRFLGNCPTPLGFLNIPSCRARIGVQQRQSIVASLISDWTVPEISLQRNGTFVNTTSGQIVEGQSVYGLNSSQIFSQQGPSEASLDNVTVRNEQANMLQFLAFTQSPSDYWYLNHTNGITGNITSEVRLVCGNTNWRFNGTIKVPGNAAGRLADSLPLKITLLAFALSIYAINA